MRKFVAIVLTATSLSACTSVERLRPDLASRVLPSRLDEIAYINALREAFVFDPQPANCYDGKELNYFRPRLEQGRPDHTKEQESTPDPSCVSYRTLPAGERDVKIRRYLEAGFGLTDLYCQRYFTIAAESAQSRKFQRNSFSALDALMNAVLSAASAGKTALAIANAGFEGVDSTYQNIDTAFLVAPDLANVRDLVHAAQGDYRTRAFGKMPETYESARAVIERYAGHCSFTGMRQLVNDSVAKTTRDLTPSQPAKPEAKPATGPTATQPAPPPASQPNEAAVPVPVTPSTQA